MKKPTKKDNFNMLLQMEEVQANQELVDFINNEIALIDKKALKSKTSKTRTANEETKMLILTTMKDSSALTVTEILNTYSDISTAVAGSNQKLTALLTQLVNENKMENMKDKKKSLYKVA